MADEIPRPSWGPWLARARDDLAVAETLLEAGSPAWAVCYHAQQAIEKGIKALLVLACEDPPKTHNLVRLNSALDRPVIPATEEYERAA